ncbi:hypothetical protein IFM89_004692, partial [Coptis chinensis]
GYPKFSKIGPSIVSWERLMDEEIKSKQKLHRFSRSILDSVCTLTPSIVYSGTTREWRIGPSIGQLDIGISDDAYFYRVSLPGVEKDAGKLSCEVERCGKINLKGFTKTGEQFVRSRLFKTKTKSLAPRGEFTISFDLPGQVDPT